MTDLTTWRTGRKVGRTIYAQIGPEPSDDDPLIGMMDTPELAAQAVGAALERDRESGIARSLKAHLVSEQERLRGHIANVRAERDQARADRDGFKLTLAETRIAAGIEYVEYEHQIGELRHQRDAALALADELLRPWNTGRPVHPGRVAIAAGYVDLAQVRAWEERRRALGWEPPEATP